MTLDTLLAIGAALCAFNVIAGLTWLYRHRED
jgi:hypothetical protein